jgi:hypothetical protein
MERSRRILYRGYWARRAFGSRVIFDLSCVSIATVTDLMVYADCSPVRRRPASDLITFGNKSIPEMPVHGHDPQSIPEVWGRGEQDDNDEENVGTAEDNKDEENGKGEEKSKEPEQAGTENSEGPDDDHDN